MTSQKIGKSRPDGTPMLEPLEGRMLFTSAVDPSWGGGLVKTGSGQAGTVADKILVQPNGQVVVAGSSGNGANTDEVFVSRFNNDGTVDATFGSGGTVITPLPFDVVSAISAQTAPGDKTVVLASATSTVKGKPGTFHEVFASILLRYTAAGQLDKTFGHGGKVSIPANRLTIAGGLVVDSKGHITVAGQHDLPSRVSAPNPAAAFEVIRYTAAGRLDPSFGQGGIVLERIGFSDSVLAMVTASDGSLAIGGRAVILPQDNLGQLAVLRLSANGKPDPLFGHKGVMLAGIGYRNLSISLAVNSWGDVIVVSGPEVTEYTADGQPDTHFGSGGMANVLVPHGFDSFSYFNAIVLAGQNEIALGGPDVELLQSDGNPDTSFGNGGQSAPADTALSLATDFVSVGGVFQSRLYVLERVGFTSQFGIERYDLTGTETIMAA